MPSTAPFPLVIGHHHALFTGRSGPARFRLGESPERKKPRQFNNLEHVVIGKVLQLCRNML
jgi:hypothetical protein